MQTNENSIEIGRHLSSSGLQRSVLLDPASTRGPIIIAEGGFAGGACHISLAELIQSPGHLEHAYLCGASWLVELAFTEQTRDRPLSSRELVDRWQEETVSRPKPPNAAPAFPLERSRLDYLRMRWKKVRALPCSSDPGLKLELEPDGALSVTVRDLARRRIIAELEQLLRELLPSDGIRPVAIATTYGVLRPDLAWSPKSVTQRSRPLVLQSKAPPLCLDLVDRGEDRQRVLRRKSAFCFAGAQEYWTCSTVGVIHFHTATGEIERSGLFPEYPSTLPAPGSKNGGVQ